MAHTRRTFVAFHCVAVAAGLAGCGGHAGGSGALSATPSAPAPGPNAPSPSATPVQSAPPPPPPKWMTAAVGHWAQLGGTAAPPALAAYSGVGWREDAGAIEIFSGVAGGHAAGQYVTNNEVFTLRLDVDSPTWVRRRAASNASGWDSSGQTSPYMPDGRPASRHVYCDANWSPDQGAYLVGGLFWGSLGIDYPVLDAFIPAGDSDGDWAPSGSFPPRPVGAGGYFVMLSAQDPATGMLYGTTRADGSLLFRFNAKSKAWTRIALSGSGNVNMGGNAFDTRRGQIFNLSNASWLVPAPGVNSTVIDPNTGGMTLIAFRPSAAWADFQASATQFALTALSYDAWHDCFYFYNGDTYGLAGQTQKVYRITPNDGAVWDMDFLPILGGVVPAAAGDSGVLTRFKYVQRLNALVLLVPGEDIYYMRLPL